MMWKSALFQACIFLSCNAGDNHYGLTEEVYSEMSESRTDSQAKAQIGFCHDTVLIHTVSFYHAVPEVAQHIWTTLVNGQIAQIDSTSIPPPFHCANVQTIDSYIEKSSLALNASCGAGMHEMIKSRINLPSGRTYHFQWAEKTQDRLAFWLDDDSKDVEHIRLRGDWARVVCKDIDADGIDDLIVLSTTDGYLGPNQHIQVFKVQISSK